MNAFVTYLRRVGHEASGQDMVEYALLVGFLSLGIFIALVAARDAIIAVWTLVTNIMFSVAALI
jgi:Flp pilus assembly pilin Flp